MLRNIRTLPKLFFERFSLLFIIITLKFNSVWNFFHYLCPQIKTNLALIEREVDFHCHVDAAIFISR